jgi:polyphosphate kinase
MTQNEPRFLNRELSWLAFNERVLEEAEQTETPLLERLKFLAITASNLDEFFMVRVGGLQMLAGRGSRKKDPAGMTPKQQLAAISRRMKAFTLRQQACFQTLEKELRENGIRRLRSDELSAEQLHYAEQFFNEEIFPVVSPLPIATRRRFPPLMNRMLHIAVALAPEPGKRTPRRALLPLGHLSRRVRLPATNTHDYILLEDLVALFVDRFFIGQEVRECTPFRITRNADLSLQEDLAYDLLSGMEDVLSARRHGHCVRLELSASCSLGLKQTLSKSLKADPQHITQTRSPLALSDFMSLAGLETRDDLRVENWTPQAVPDMDPKTSIFETIRQKDRLLYHPYDSFDPVLRLIDEAADDPDVLAIKQILYRTSKNSPVIAALCRAAENGKYVTAIVELKARFDEERNITWAKELENAGVQVIYGIRNLKTHAKICIVVRREHGFVRRYMHFGTGNYNESTAKLYTDISLLTAAEDFGDDASAFFNAITGYSDPPDYKKISPAPTHLREKILEYIEGEIIRSLDGQKSRIIAKFNSLACPEIIEALYRASQAGVKIDLNVRGICCLRPGVKGLSENIRVVSIVDRLLEHSRILYFLHGGDEQVLISSADWMPRNLDRRIELLVPVEGASEKKTLIHYLKASFKDTVKARICQPDGSYLPASEKKKSVRSQQMLYQEAVERAKEARRRARTVFEPHKPQK